MKLSFYDDIIKYIEDITSTQTTGQIHHLSRIVKITHFIKNSLINKYDEILNIDNKTNRVFRLKDLYSILVERDTHIFQFYRIEMENNEYHIIGTNCKIMIMKGMIIFIGISDDEKKLISFLDGIYGYNWRSIGSTKYKLVEDFMFQIYTKYSSNYDIIVDTNSILTLF